MERSRTRIAVPKAIITIALVSLLSLVGLSVVGVGQAYGAAPTIKSLLPTSGNADGGTPVVIDGTGFSGATAVTFAGQEATSFTVNNGTHITATAPPVLTSNPTADVVVTVAGLQSTPAAPGDNVFTYTWTSPPTVTGVGQIPVTASSETGTTVTITAAGTWTTGEEVSLAGFVNGLNSAVYTVVTGGSGSFTVTFAGALNGSVSGAGVVSPSLSGAVGSTTGGTPVYIFGTDFAGASGVDFGSTAVSSFTVVSTTEITTTAPAGTVGPVDVTVTTPGATSVTSPIDTFSYVSTPTVTGITTVANPAGGPTGGGTQVTIAGGSFSGVTAVHFGSASATYTVNALNSITATSPAGTGTVDVTVTTGQGTSTTSSADQFAYDSTLTLADGTGSYSNSPGTAVPVTGTSQTGSTVTIDAIGTWTTGQEIGLSALTNGLPAATYTAASGATGSFTITYAPALSGSGTGTATILNTVTPSAVTATSQSGSTVTLTSSGTWATGQKVYLTGFTNGLTAGNYTLTGGGNGSFTVTGTTTASGSGSALPYQVDSFNAATLVTGGGTINPASVTVTAQPASGTVAVVGTQLLYTPVQPTPTSYTVSGTTTWLSPVSTTGNQTATFSICQSSPNTNCTSATITYLPAGSGDFVGNQIIDGSLIVSVVEDTGSGVSAPASAPTGSTFTTVTAPPVADLPAVNSGFTVLGIGGYRSITPVPAGVTLVPGSLSVSGGDTASSGAFTATLCTAAMGYVAGTCTANNFGNFITSYPYIETSLNAGDQIAGGSQLTLPTVTASWMVTAGSGSTISSTETEFVVVTSVASLGVLDLDAFPSNLASDLNQGLGAPAPTYSPPLARWSVNVTAAIAPTITSAASTTFAVGSPGSFTVTATGSPAPTFSVSGSLPSGVSLNSTTGVLSGTPAAGTGGSYPITITAMNGASPNATQSFTLIVDQAPTITSAASTTFTAGSAGTFTVTASGYPAPTFSVSGSLPSGVSLNSSTGVLSGTPAAGTGGTYPITITASNLTSPNATQSFTLIVDQAPTITSAASTTFTAGSAGTFTVTASGYPAPTFSVSGSLPSGVSLNSSTGVLSGTPAAGTGGTYPITITASNLTSPNATQPFTLTVDQAPTITSAASASFTIGTDGTFTVTASGYPASTFTETGTLPGGVTLNSATGVLSGTPVVGSNGSYPITITASNLTSPNATQPFTLSVAIQPTAPSITSADSTTFTVGTADSFTVTATGYPASTFSESGSLPSGVSLDPTTGILSGTPAVGSGGSYPITLTASNGVSPDATQSFTLTVDEAPSITSGSSTTFTVGTAGTFTVTASGYPASTFSESGALPGGVTLNSTTGVLSGIPATGSGGSYPITVTAANGVGTAATQSFSLTVDEAPAITSADSATFTVGSAGTFTVTASGYPASTFSETGGLPTGVSLDPTTGVLSGTPAVGSGGSYPITVTATNGISPDATQSFTLTVDEAPSITSADSTTFTAGSAGTFTVTASGYPASSFSESGTLPGGVTLDPSTGTLSGTPIIGSSGTYPITITASNGTSPDATQSFTLTVVTTSSAPSITSADSTTFTVGTAGTFTVTASGNPAPTFSESGSLPSGVSLDPTTGILSGTPAVGSGGSYPITLTAANGVSPDATQSFTLTVDEAPSITSADSATFTVGSAGTFTVTASGYPASTFSESGALPSGVSLDPTTGILSGTPAVGGGGSYPITLTAANGVGTAASQSFTLTVNEAPSITSADSATFTVGSAGTFTVTASGYPASTFSESGTLPSGVSLDSSTGVLSGTPAVGSGGSYPITVTATNGISPDATQSFTLTVDEAPSITSADSATFAAGSAGTFTVTASGYPASTFSESGSLPSGVSLDPTTGILSGTPAVGSGGSYPITLTASNGVSPDATQSFTLTVDEAPSITSADSATFTVGSAGTFTVTASGYPASTFSESGSLPSGVSLDPTTGVLSGTPAAGSGGSYPITLTASNGVSPAGTQDFTLTVDQAPVITSGASATFTVGSAGTFTVTATGYPAPTFSESGSLPGGVTLDATTGVLSGTPVIGSSGTYPITITASNGVSPAGTQDFTLTVPAVGFQITTTSLPNATVGTAYGPQQLTTEGGGSSIVWKKVSLPKGFTLSSTGVLTGTPSSKAIGPQSVDVSASSDRGTPVTASISLIVDEAPVFGKRSPIAATFDEGVAGSATVTAVGYPAPTFSESGSLPSGVTFDGSTGVLSGTPATTVNSSSYDLNSAPDSIWDCTARWGSVVASNLESTT